MQILEVPKPIVITMVSDGAAATEMLSTCLNDTFNSGLDVGL